MIDKKTKRILVVDDDHECRLLLSTFVAQAGYRVDAVADGAMALTMMQSQPPDVVLLDANLPRLDGFEVCRRIRANEKTQHTPVVIITAFSTEDTKQRGLAVGADEYVQKPFRAENVLEIVEQLLKISAARRQLDAVDPTNIADALRGGRG